MKFLTEKKKLFALIAMICFALTFCINLFSATSIFNSLRFMFNNFGQFLLGSMNIVSVLVGLLVSLCYVAAAFFVWKKNDHMKILGIAGVCVILNLFLGFVVQIISYFTYGYYNFGMIVAQAVSLLVADILPFIFAAYLIVFSLIKVKGPIAPIVGAALIVLMFGSALVGGVSLFISNIVNLFDYFSWNMVWNLFRNMLSTGGSLISIIGMLLLVPMAFYIPKDENLAEGEVVADAEAEVVEEEIPAAE